MEIFYWIILVIGLIMMAFGSYGTFLKKRPASSQTFEGKLYFVLTSGGFGIFTMSLILMS